MPTQTGSLDLKGLKQTYNKTIAVVQPIYCRTDSSTAPADSTRPTTVKIIKTDDTGTTAPSSNGDGWTTMLMARICSSDVSYKFLWTCQQLLAADGTVLGCTSIVEDKGTTIIDGDTVTTGTVNVGRLNVVDVITAINENGTTTINGGKITTNSLQIGHVQNLQSNLTSSANTANSYIAYINATDGIKVAAASPSSTTSNYVQITSSGINIIKDSTHKATIDANGMKIYAGSNYYRTFINSNGLTLYDGNGEANSNILANFTNAGIQIGQSNSANIKLDTVGISIFDKYTRPFFVAESLIGQTLISEYVGDGSTSSFNVYYAIENTISVTVDENAVSWSKGAYTSEYVSSVHITSTPSSGQIITITYKCIDSQSIADVYMFTMGTRGTGRGINSFAHGNDIIAAGKSSMASGSNAKAIGDYSHAFGVYATTYGHNSFSVGQQTIAYGSMSTALGYNSIAKKDYSFAANYYTIAAKEAQTVIGTSNEEDTSTTTTHPSGSLYYGKYAFIIGNGSLPSSRSNALTVDWRGNLWVASNITVTGSYYTKNSSLSLGNCVVGGYMTNNSGSIVFSIPTGRVYPTGTTINTISFNIVARAGNSNSTGTYIIKSASGGSSPASFSSTTSSTFYNGANVSKTLTTAMWRTKELHGGTNIYLVLGTDDTSTYFYSSSSINSQINNQPLGIFLGDIQVTFNIPT